MKIRLLGQGYEVFTGAFGTTEFADGMSVNDVSGADARFFASLMSIENVDGTGDPGDNAKFQSSLELSAACVTLPTLAEVQAREAAEVVTLAPAIEGQSAPVVATKHTQESLEEVADKGGINGLREIADPLGVKATSITKLISDILAKQNGTSESAATAIEGVEAVTLNEAGEVINRDAE